MGPGHHRARFVFQGQAFLGRAQAMLAQDRVRCRLAGRLRHGNKVPESTLRRSARVCGRLEWPQVTVWQLA